MGINELYVTVVILTYVAVVILKIYRGSAAEPIRSNYC
jgi:hypothetical protein